MVALQRQGEADTMRCSLLLLQLRGVELRYETCRAIVYVCVCVGMVENKTDLP
jgi:hypothetical protein